MKKFLYVLASMFMIFIVLTGCSSKKETSVDAVIKKLKKEGIPISYSIVYSESDDPNGNNKHEYNDKGNFADSRIEQTYSKDEPLSGSIEVFDNSEKAKKRAEYLDEFSSLDSFGYKVISDNILVRLSKQYSLKEVEEIAEILGGKVYSQLMEGKEKNTDDTKTIFDDLENLSEDELNKINELKEEEKVIQNEKEKVKNEIDSILQP